MNDEGLISIGEMARYARISRPALIHYDHLGLITPVKRGENNYRFYSSRQLQSVRLVATLQDIGMPLKDIAKLLRHRTPENILSMIDEYDARVERRMEKLQRTRALMRTLREAITEGIAAKEDRIETVRMREESLLLGPQIDYSDGKTIEEAMLEFYAFCLSRDDSLDLNYPVWGVFSERRIKNRDWNRPDRFYFRMPGAPDTKPEGLYLVGYARGYYGGGDALYRRMMAHMEENGLEICGPAYETYPLNEISVADSNNYLIRVSISVRRADPAHKSARKK
ncbi:MAG: MerR family transcriptional regulator [Clostridiales Family XIII bacterium]|jgi:DNA-binding transcriptional MerR regulator|nr:MerR family transcriptional regulator [Clostridiales Family XIII bacterium]